MLTKDETIQAILLIKQGLIRPNILKENKHLELIAIPESGFSQEKIWDVSFNRRTDEILYNQYRDRDGNVYKIEELPPLVHILSVFYAFTDSVKGKDAVNQIGFNQLGVKQKLHIALLKNQNNGAA